MQAQNPSMGIDHMPVGITGLPQREQISPSHSVLASGFMSSSVVAD
jgi:hypothetical protein